MYYWLTLLFYSAATFNLIFTGPRKWPLARFIFFIFMFLGLMTHTVLLHISLDDYQLKELSFFNIFSLTAWMMSLLLTFISLKEKESLNLFYIVLPLTLISILLVPMFGVQEHSGNGLDFRQIFHVAFALLTFSIFSLAALQALLLAIQERRLQKNRFISTIEMEPLALEKIETHLFRLLSGGFILLTLLIASSFLSFGVFEHLTKLNYSLGKIVLAVSSWVIFGIVLIGRYAFGWRGKKAIYSTLSGFTILIIIYYGSEYLL